MLSYENGGISGNGQKSRKRAKFHKGKEEKMGGGKGKRKSSNGNTDQEKESQKKAGSWLSMVHYPWTGKELESAQEGGLGIIPIEDQFRAISENSGVDYVSYHFTSSPEMVQSGSQVKIFGENCIGKEQSLTVEIEVDGAVLECSYESLVVIWVAKKWIIESN